MECLAHTARCRPAQHIHSSREEPGGRRGNARRVAIVFAQKWFQPLQRFFQLDKLWAGHVEAKTELRAIEQYFIHKHNTQMEHRRREPTLSKDLDLMNQDAPPRRS